MWGRNISINTPSVSSSQSSTCHYLPLQHASPFSTAILTLPAVTFIASLVCATWSDARSESLQTITPFGRSVLDERHDGGTSATTWYFGRFFSSFFLVQRVSDMVLQVNNNRLLGVNAIIFYVLFQHQNFSFTLINQKSLIYLKKKINLKQCCRCS